MAPLGPREGEAELTAARFAAPFEQLYEAETEYFTGEYTQLGNIFRGFDGFMSSKDTLRRRAKTFKLEDRLFSLSSRTSPAAKEEIKEEVALVKAKGKSKGMKRSRSARDAGNPQSHKKKK